MKRNRAKSGVISVRPGEISTKTLMLYLGMLNHMVSLEAPDNLNIQIAPDGKSPQESTCTLALALGSLYCSAHHRGQIILGSR